MNGWFRPAISPKACRPAPVAKAEAETKGTLAGAFPFQGAF